MEPVYFIIKNYSGKATRKQIEREIHTNSKNEVQYAILRLVNEGKIERIRGFGPNRIEYFYKITWSTNAVV